MFDSFQWMKQLRNRMTAKFLESCSHEVFHFYDDESMKRRFSFYRYVVQLFIVI